MGATFTLGAVFTLTSSTLVGATFTLGSVFTLTSSTLVGATFTLGAVFTLISLTLVGEIFVLGIGFALIFLTLRSDSSALDLASISTALDLVLIINNSFSSLFNFNNRSKFCSLSFLEFSSEGNKFSTNFTPVLIFCFLI